MASVSSLDKDLRHMRLSRYTPQAAAEVRDWIEEVLHERLPAGDLLEALKDGVALCMLVNLAVSPGVKFKKSSMPFVQMENISHFLRACQMAPLGLPPHDVFLTVDLYEGKDPAQVLQCLGAFSRRACTIQPSRFPRPIGAQSRGGVVSPHLTGSSQGAQSPSRGISNATSSSISGHSSPGKSPSVSTWSKKTDEHSTMPAWNIHQYGYMGGASQANQGVAFGARRQITSAAPSVPSLQEKERRRREEEDRLHQEREEAERARQLEREEDEARAKAEEERRWEEETARQRESKRRDMEAERRRWDEEQRKWEEEERRRVDEETAVEEKFESERQRRRGGSDARLNGQFLSQYQATQTADDESAGSQRIKELERELVLAKERELEYERERLDLQAKKKASEAESRNRTRVPVPPKPSYDLSSLEQERRMLRKEWQTQQSEQEPIAESTPPISPRPLPEPTPTEVPPTKPPRPLPEPTSSTESPPPMPPRHLTSPSNAEQQHGTPTSPRPLPDPTAYTPPPQSHSRVDRFLSSNRPPVAAKPVAHRPQDYSTTAEVDAENSRRAASTQKTRAGGWASKSLLEREMERERERQREWEENQKQTSEVAERGQKDGSLGTAPGEGAWDVHQYGYLGGDSQNRGGPGLGVGGARRQIIGPRPPR